MVCTYVFLWYFALNVYRKISTHSIQWFRSKRKAEIRVVNLYTRKYLLKTDLGERGKRKKKEYDKAEKKFRLPLLGRLSVLEKLETLESLEISSGISVSDSSRSETKIRYISSIVIHMYSVHTCKYYPNF